MDFEYEPMEVDLSNSSNYAMDISYNDISINAHELKIKKEPCDSESKENVDQEIQFIAASPTVIKRFSVNMPARKEKVPLLSTSTLSVIFTLLAIISLFTYQIVNLKCSNEINLVTLKESLTKNVFGQPQAIVDIISSLEAKSSSKLLILYGGTGVGKTLTISLILENLYQYANIYHYTMPSFVETISTDIMLGLTLCPTSMVVIDDLNRTDMHVQEHVKKILDKSENLNKNMTIILSFHCATIDDQYIGECDYSFYSDLNQAFSEIKALKTFIKFNSLNEYHLRKCIEKEFGSKTLTEEKYHNIVKNFNVSADGCKGVYTKLKLLNVL